MSDVLELELAMLARLKFDGPQVSNIVYAPVLDPDTAEMADSYFSWGGCICCRDGGALVHDVHIVAFVGSGTGCTMSTVEAVCGSCLCGLINGDWSGCL